MNREKKYQRVLQAFYDGVRTGIDPIGAIRGHITKQPIYNGYMADQYSITYNDLEANFLFGYGGPSLLEPTRRTIDEQVVKAVGDLCGLTLNLFFGFPQWFSMISASENREYAGFALKANDAIERGEVEVPGRRPKPRYNPSLLN